MTQADSAPQAEYLQYICNACGYIWLKRPMAPRQAWRRHAFCRHSGRLGLPAVR
jgi:hypothetical protein